MCPFICACLTYAKRCSMLSSSKNHYMSLPVDCGPLSLTIVWRIPYLHIIRYFRNLITWNSVVEARAFVPTHFEKYSMTTMIHFWCTVDRCRGIIRLIPHWAKDHAPGIGTNSVGGCPIWWVGGGGGVLLARLACMYQLCRLLQHSRPVIPSPQCLPNYRPSSFMTCRVLFVQRSQYSIIVRASDTSNVRCRVSILIQQFIYYWVIWVDVVASIFIQHSI